MIPETSTAQLEAATRRSIEVRRERAKLKARIKSGDLSVSEALDPGNEAAAGLRVFEFARSCPNVGSKTARKILIVIGIPERRHLRGLGRRQREALRALLELAVAGELPRNRDSIETVLITAN